MTWPTDSSPGPRLRRIAASLSPMVAFALLIGCRGGMEARPTVAATVVTCGPVGGEDAAATCVSGTPGPAGELAPALPRPDIPTTNRQGYRFRLEATATVDFSSVPREAPVFALSDLRPTEEDVERLAQALRIGGPVERREEGAFVAGENGELYVSPELTQFLSPDGAVGGPLPSDQEAVTLARDWLRQTRLGPADVGEGRVVSRIEETGRIVIVFGPKEPERLLAAYPSITVSLGSGGTVVEATARWAEITRLDLFELRDVRDAWFEVEGGRAYLEADLGADGPPPGSEVVGTVRYTAIEIAYTTAGPPDGRQYLEPVYAFRGHLTLAGQSTSYPVTAYVPALAEVKAPVGVDGRQPT